MGLTIVLQEFYSFVTSKPLQNAAAVAFYTNIGPLLFGLLAVDAGTYAFEDFSKQG